MNQVVARYVPYNTVYCAAISDSNNVKKNYEISKKTNQ